MAEQIQLTYGPVTITLGVPIFGDTDTIEQTRINRETRAGDTRIYKDSQWPTTEKLVFQFDDLSQKQVKDYLDFIDLTLGRTIFLTDQNLQIWEGIIVNPDVQAEQKGNEKSCDGFALELQFEGIQG